MDMRWNGWGDPGQAKPLPEEATRLLRDLLGVRPAETPAVPLDQLTPPPGRLAPEARTALVEAVGEEHLREDDETRVRHTGGKSTPDLLRMRSGSTADAPDAVVLPADHDQVLAVLRICSAHRVAVVPFGGGTSVVGGLSPLTGRTSADGADGTDGGDALTATVALDLRRLDRLTEVDPVSRTAELGAGLRGPRAEALLAEHGLTLGHFPQSFEWATVGGFAAARSSGQSSAGYGRFDEMVMALRVATPRGTLTLGRAPRSAAGPDLRQLLLGSEGTLGVITSVTVRVHPVPERTHYEGWRFPSFEAGQDALRQLVQDGPLPTVLRLSDETETMVGLADPSAIGEALNSPEQSGGCLVITGYEGTGAEVEQRRAGAHHVLEQAGGRALGEGPGQDWARGRYSGPYLRDALLDVGAFAETLETAAFWSRLPQLYQAVRTALTDTLTAAGTPPLVLCHISHVYPTGASLYFTVVSAQGPTDPVAHWAVAKEAANRAILDAGGTISHHHGVGVDHRESYREEIGPLGVELLHAVKERLDPTGVLNPGVLLPPVR
ncbi:FAD-binding oxidoreductase [Streptomyces sp. NPDC005438]|uniref:FAD-binding oxidoreductase n=1 Tax=Streptomyces sp. NPDC005438 TaxID=3156880 RepID=UPI0033AA5F00